MKLPFMQTPYEYDSLRYISAKTMEIHHNQLYRNYTDKTNNLFSVYGISEYPSVILSNSNKYPKDLIQSLGGYVNHSLLWQWLQPPVENNKPFGLSEKLINNLFGSFENFKEQVNQLIDKSFGSQWLWFSYNKKTGDFSLYLSENQENPLMKNEIAILGIDLWEHSYLLDYESKKIAYLDAIWKITNWKIVNFRINRYIYN
jgi:Fe-Mn family superoxide dismutase